MKNIACCFALAAVLFLSISCKSRTTGTANNSADTSARPAQNTQTTVVQDASTDTIPANQKDSSPSNPFQSLIDKMAGTGKDSNTSQALPKLGSLMQDSTGNPGNAIGNAILNLQLSQMKDNNPLKQAAQGMMAAEKNGTALSAKTYTAVYKPEQPADYKVPVEGSGAVYKLQYTGGTSSNGKKDGLWKNIYVNTENNTTWNVFSESYMESSAINMKAHSSTISDKDSSDIISFNAQYQKYNREKIATKGKNESDVQVQKIGTEKLFGFNCVHIRLSYTVTALHQTSHITEDEWYSDEVPGAQFLSPAILESHAPAAIQKIMAAGCSGALVKLRSKEMLFQLSGITKSDSTDAVFALPANYQPDKNTDLYGIQ